MEENETKDKNKNELFLQKKKLEYDIIEKRLEITSIENKYEEKEYYIKVGDILFDYYNIFTKNENENETEGNENEGIENSSDNDMFDDDFSMNDNSDVDSKSGDLSGNEENQNSNEFTTKNNNESTTKNSVNKKSQMTMFDFFNMQCINLPANTPSLTFQNDDNFVQKDILSFFDNKKPNSVNSNNDNKNNQKSVLHHKYMHEIPKFYNPELKKTNLTYCPECGIERIMMVTEGILVCQQCCYMDKVIVDSERPSFREPPPEISYFAYKRINHFNEWLNQFQAKESSEIPPEVFDQIILELRKEKNLNLRNLKKSRVREILSKLKLNRYYEHVSHIIYKINGIPPPSIPNDLEEILRNMFRTIQGPFMKVCPEIAKKRKNFLSYSYVLHKFLELLNYDELKKQFPLLKSREKLHRQDKIWQGICKELGWQFIRSI
jgi:hypothetical protein